MAAHLAANGSQLFGCRRVFAQQAHHGVNRAAGVGVGVVGGGCNVAVWFASARPGFSAGPTGR